VNKSQHQEACIGYTYTSLSSTQEAARRTERDGRASSTYTKRDIGEVPKQAADDAAGLSGAGPCHH